MRVLNEKVKVFVEGYGVIEAHKGVNLGKLLSEHGLLALPCGGRGFCGQCKVFVEGMVSSPTGNELARGMGHGGVRLACQTRVLGDVRVRLPRIQSVIKPVSRIAISVTISRPKPVFSLGENRVKLLDAVECVCDYARSDGNVLLVDIGTTKIAYQVLDRKTDIVKENLLVNPMVAYGADIITRMTRAVQEPNSYARMRKLLTELLIELATENSSPLIVAAGNTVMESMVLGLPLHSLAMKPFEPAAKGPFLYTLGSPRKCYGIMLLAPLVAGFVGGDAVMNLAAVEYMRAEKPFMIIDLGTNTEVILATQDDYYATSCPAGPAFEGHVSGGTSITLGGASKARFRGFREDGEAILECENGRGGLLGSGVISLVAELVRHKLLSSNGRLTRGYKVVNGVKTLRITCDENGQHVLFTQRDVREFQKAMAAVRASWKKLLNKAGLDPSELRRVFVSGLFGSALDAQDLLLLDLVPPVSEDRIVSSGDLVLPGMKAYVYDENVFLRINRLVRKIVHVNLAEEKDFMNLWTSSLSFRVTNRD